MRTIVVPRTIAASLPKKIGVASMADEEDMPPFFDQSLSLPVNLRNQWTGRIDVGEATALRLGGHRLGHAVRGKYHRPIIRYFVELIHEHRSELSKPVDHELVMDDFVADVDGGAEALECKLDDLDRAVDARAKTAWRRDEHTKWRVVQHSDRHIRLRLQP